MTLHRTSFLPGVHEKIVALDAALAQAFQDGDDLEIDDLLEQRYELHKWVEKQKSDPKA